MAGKDSQQLRVDHTVGVDHHDRVQIVNPPRVDKTIEPELEREPLAAIRRVEPLDNRCPCCWASDAV